MTDANLKRLEAMNIAQLVELYNRVSVTKVKRFESRAVALRRVGIAITKSQLTATLPNASPKTKQGRPTKSYPVRIRSEPGTSRFQSKSFRSQILNAIRTEGDKGISTSSLVETFGPKALGAVSKLVLTRWVERLEE